MPDDKITSKFIQNGLDAPITQDQIKLPESVDDLLALRKIDDEASLAILKQDNETAESDKVIKDLTQQWTISDQLLQQPWLTNYYYNPGKTNIPRYTLSNIIDVVTTKAHNAIFFDSPFFMLRPKPSVDQKVMWAKEVILTTQLDEENAEDEFDKGWFQCAHLGTQMYKYGWTDDVTEEMSFVRKAEPIEVDDPKGGKMYLDTVESDQFEMKPVKKDIHRPWLKWRDLRYVRVAPTWNVGDARFIPWLIDSEYPTFEELDAFRGKPGYEIPSREDLEYLFFPPEVQQPQGGDVSETRPISYRAWIPHAEGREVNDTADPYGKKIKWLERWDKHRVTVALVNKHGYLLIRNELHGNKDDCGRPAVPYLSSNWRDTPDNGFGQGLGQLIGPDQQVEKGVLCALLDILSFIAKPSYVRQKPLNQQGQNEVIDLGKIISVEGKVDEYMKVLEQPKVDATLIQAIGSAQASAATTSGANELIGMGGTTGAGRGTGMRSGTGAAAVETAQQGRLDGPLNKFCRRVLVPWLYIMDRMNCERLPAHTMREIVGNDPDANHVYKNFDHMTFRNTKVDFEILAGSQLSARSKMAAFAPQLAAILSSPAVMQAADAADMIFEVETYTKFTADLAGYKYVDPFFRKKTDAEKQAEQQRNAQAQQQKGQQAIAQIGAKHQGKMQEIDQTQLGKAANEVLRQGFEKEFAGEGESGESY